MENKTIVIALTGKGGVGKTSLSALTVRLLKEQYPDKKILAIDADPAIGLATALNAKVTTTVDSIRKMFIDNVEDGNTKAALEMLSEAKYQLMDALDEDGNVSFLAIGRPESAGCYCKVNNYLKQTIALISNNYDYVVIDGEAGIEQVNRRVMEKVTHLILVSDASKKGLQVVKTIYDVASDLVMFEKAGLIINRISDLSYASKLDSQGLDVLTYIEDDKNMTLSDMEGKSVYELSANTPIYIKCKEALKNLGIL